MLVKLCSWLIEEKAKGVKRTFLGNRISILTVSAFRESVELSMINISVCLKNFLFLLLHLPQCIENEF